MAAHEKLRIFLRLCKIIDFFVFWGENVGNEQPFDNLIHDNLGELMLSQRSDLLKQSLDFYESDVLPATQPIVSKHYMKVQWFGRLLIHRHGKTRKHRELKKKLDGHRKTLAKFEIQAVYRALEIIFIKINFWYCLKNTEKLRKDYTMMMMMMIRGEDF